MNWLSKIKYTFEPGELCLTKRKIESLDPTNLVLHGWRDEFRKFDWVKHIPSPEFVVKDVNYLCSLVETKPN